MCTFLKFGQVVPEIFEFQCSKNEVFLDKTQREIAYLKWLTKEGYWRLFNNFLGISAYNFVKNNPTFENKNLFDAKRYGA